MKKFGGRKRTRGLLIVLVVVAVLVALGGRGRNDTSDGRSAIPTSTSPSTSPSSGAAAATVDRPGPTPTTSVSAAAPTGPTGSTRTTVTTQPAALAPVDSLMVATPGPDVAPYRRAMFGDGWDYDPVSKCNTRERVLIAESVIPAVLDTKCRPTGQWRSAYDGVVTTNIADLEIDHLVPLADVWRAGASAWTPVRRRAYANDLSDPNTLIAVTSRTNRSKSDSAPDQWLPPDRSEWCTYASGWVEVKVRWHLSVTPAEKATLVQILSGCGT